MITGTRFLNSMRLKVQSYYQAEKEKEEKEENDGGERAGSSGSAMSS